MEQLVLSPKLLGNAIHRQRKKKGLSQQNAGQPFKIDQSTLSNVERGTPGTQIDTIFRILAALDLEMVIRTKDLDQAAKHEESW